LQWRTIGAARRAWLRRRAGHLLAVVCIGNFIADLQAIAFFIGQWATVSVLACGSVAEHFRHLDRLAHSPSIRPRSFSIASSWLFHVHKKLPARDDGVPGRQASVI